MRTGFRLLVASAGCLLLAAAAAGDEVAAPAAPPEAPDTVVLDTGEVLRGRIRFRDETVLVLEHPVLGVIELPAARVKAVGPLAAAAPGSPAPEEAARPGLFGTGLLAGWERSVGIGLAGTSGNSDTFNANGEVNGKYEDERDRWTFGSSYLLAAEGSSTTKNQAFAQLEKAWLFPGSRWFAFSRGRWDYDEFKDFDHRVAAAAGPGFHFLQTERFTLDGRLAPGVNRTIGGDDDDTTFEALAGLDFTWKVAEDQEFSTTHEIYPSFTDLGEYRTLSSADYKIKLTDWGLNLKLGVRNEYLSNAEEENNDLTYLGNLVYDF